MNIKKVSYNIIDSNVSKELSGFRIALFSDSHNTFYGEHGERLIRELETLDADIVVFAGDAVKQGRYETGLKEEYDNSIKLFSELGRRFRTYYINGNHDNRLRALCEGKNAFADCYFSGKAAKAKENIDKNIENHFGHFIKTITDAGVVDLSNSSVDFADKKLHVSGLDLPLIYYRHGAKAPGTDLINSLIGAPSEGSFNLLIAHTPQFFADYADWGAQLTLCGHMHGGIIRLPFVGGVFSPYRSFFPKYDYGLFKKGKSRMIVTSGCGTRSFRESLTNPHEIVLITLSRKV